MAKELSPEKRNEYITIIKNYLVKNNLLIERKSDYFGTILNFYLDAKSEKQSDYVLYDLVTENHDMYSIKNKEYYFDLIKGIIVEHKDLAKIIINNTKLSKKKYEDNYCERDYELVVYDILDSMKESQDIYFWYVSKLPFIKNNFNQNILDKVISNMDNQEHRETFIELLVNMPNFKGIAEQTMVYHLVENFIDNKEKFKPYLINFYKDIPDNLIMQSKKQESVSFNLSIDMLNKLNLKKDYDANMIPIHFTTICNIINEKFPSLFNMDSVKSSGVKEDKTEKYLKVNVLGYDLDEKKIGLLFNYICIDFFSKNNPSNKSNVVEAAIKSAEAHYLSDKLQDNLDTEEIPAKRITRKV